jgi:hypothetical protein
MAAKSLPPLDKLDPARAWQAWEPAADDPWGLKWAGHLYRRAGFGATPAEMDAAVKRGTRATIDLLLAGEPGAQALISSLHKSGELVAGATTRSRSSSRVGPSRSKCGPGGSGAC